MKTVGVRIEWREEGQVRFSKTIFSEWRLFTCNVGQEVDSVEVAGDFNQWEKVPLFLQCEEDESVWWTMLEVNILVGLFKLLGIVLRSCQGATSTGSWSMGSGRIHQVSTEGKCHFNL